MTRAEPKLPTQQCRKLPSAVHDIAALEVVDALRCAEYACVGGVSYSVPILVLASVVAVVVSSEEGSAENVGSWLFRNIPSIFGSIVYGVEQVFQPVVVEEGRHGSESVESYSVAVPDGVACDIVVCAEECVACVRIFQTNSIVVAGGEVSHCN